MFVAFVPGPSEFQYYPLTGTLKTGMNYIGLTSGTLVTTTSEFVCGEDYKWELVRRNNSPELMMTNDGFMLY